VPSVDASGEVARQFALNVRRAMNGCSLREAQVITGVHHTTIQAVLQGQTWPDLDTIARLERGFGVPLWPGLSEPSGE
jgi:transcriptional regulator with XRE-family HTH domain